MKDLLNAYKEITSTIFKSFGIENGYGDIDDKTDMKWDFTSDSLHWEEDGDLYSNDIIRGPAKFDNFVLYFVDNGCGDEFYQIFDMNLRDEELEG